MYQKFGAAVDQILNFRWKSSPVEATSMGIHEYDGELDQVDGQARQEYIQKLLFYLKGLGEFKKDDLSKDEQMDWEILYNSLEVEVKLEQGFRRYERDASLCPEIALVGCYLLMMREFAPLEDRMKSVLSRMGHIPRLLDQAKQNLKQGKNIPRIWSQLGIEMATNGKQFFTTFVPEFAEKVPELKKELLSVNQKATAAFDDYLKFVTDELLPKSNGDFKLGQDLFDFLLKKYHQLPYNTEQLLSVGHRLIKETEEQARKLSSQIDPQKDWFDLIAQLKKSHTSKDGLLGFYTDEMKRARDFVRVRDLVTIPAGENLRVIETPLFQRNVMPYGAYVPPAPFEEKQEGFFWVTPINENLPPEQQEEQLEGHNNFGAVLTALHEAYPGHHLQLIHSNRVDSKVRRQFGTSLFAEGWALYCEELMYEQGFYSDPRTRLHQLKDQLWRACRVVIDVSLHIGKMNFDQAVDMLVNVARLEKTNAIAEVKRYTQTPTQPMTYCLGKIEILNLRDEVKAKKGENFNLKQFHDQLLSYGTIPIKMVRRRMLEE